jgi:translation elongation factor P
MTYLYNDGTSYVVMDEKTFEQFELSPDKFGDAARFLLENMRVQVSFYEDEALFAELPISVDLKVEHTEPGLQGDRSSGGTKPATLETGAEIQVPLFIEIGNVLKIDTRTGEYLSRVNN